MSKHDVRYVHLDENTTICKCVKCGITSNYETTPCNPKDNKCST